MNNKWEKEFFQIEFKDARLKDRFFHIMNAFSSSPDQSILAASGSRSSAKAVYRFLANEAVSYSALLDSVSKATIQKLSQIQAGQILLLQDTTSLSFGNRKGMDGIGYYCDSNQKGMFVHSCIAVTDTGLPIGLVFQEISTRTYRKMNTQSKEEQKLRPIKEKENFRWISTLRNCHERIPQEISTLTICDREGDFYELFADAEKSKEQFLVRLTQNRLTMEGKRLFELLKASKVKGSLVLQIGRNPKEHLPARNIKMEYHYETIQIKKPKRRKEEHLQESLTVTAIYVHETIKKEDISWFLITNVPIKTAKEAEKQIYNYVQRWKIERFHYILKSGCKIEEKQVRSYEALKILTLLYSVIALQILNLTYMGRLCPELPAEIFWEDWEWKVLYCAARKTKKLPNKKYTIKEAVSDIAVLGGRKGAKSDGEPGVRSVWKGLEKLNTLLSYQEFLV